MKIQGYAALKPSTPLQPFSYEVPPLEPFEVLIRISHSGLCHTDLHMIENVWRRSTYPLLPGHEIVGAIVQKGTLVEQKLGTRVGVGWTRVSCLSCPECQRDETNICPKKIGIYNQGRFGGFADHVIADSRFIFPIPEAIDSAHAAPLLCAGATVYAPIPRYQLTPSHSIGVIGIGGLGHLALQFYRALGSEVSAISSTSSKESEAKQFGAAHFYTLERLPPPNSLDFILCTIDASLPWNQILSLLRPNGTLCFVSRPSELSIDPAYLVSPQRSISGSNNANRPTMNEMLSFAAHHQIRPQIELMPLSQINQAIERIRANKVRYRIVLTP